MDLRFGLEDRPGTLRSAAYALQWLAVSLPFVVIAGTVAAGHHSPDPAFRTAYLQKATFVTGLMLLSQASFGHRLTLVAGPATALLLGILGSGASPDAVYTAAALCGAALAVLSAAGLFGMLRNVFSRRVTSAVILLLAFTLVPTVAGLLTAGGSSPGRLSFAAIFVAALFLAHRLLPPAGRSFLILAGMATGALAHAAVFGGGGASAPAGPAATVSWLFSGFTRPVFDPGAVISFAFCFLALTLNEIGSMQAVAPLLRAGAMEHRTRRGMTVAGSMNVLAGFLGVIGPVDYSLSPGVIAAGGCGSRFPLFPASALLLAASFFPAVPAAVGSIPSAVIGGVLVYTLSGQVAAGMETAFGGGGFTFEDGLVIGLPLLAGSITAFLPPEALADMPAAVRSVAGNGFVVGIVSVLALDRIFPREGEPGSGPPIR